MDNSSTKYNAVSLHNLNNLKSKLAWVIEIGHWYCVNMLLTCTSKLHREAKASQPFIITL